MSWSQCRPFTHQGHPWPSLHTRYQQHRHEDTLWKFVEMQTNSKKDKQKRCGYHISVTDANNLLKKNPSRLPLFISDFKKNNIWRHYARNHQTPTQTWLSAKGAPAFLSLFSFTVIPPSATPKLWILKKSNDLDKATWYCPWQKSFLGNERGAVKPSVVGQPLRVSRWLNGQIDGICEVIASLERHHLHLERRVVRSSLWYCGAGEMRLHTSGTMWMPVKFPKWRQTARSVIYSPFARFIQNEAGRALKCRLTQLRLGLDGSLNLSTSAGLLAVVTCLIWEPRKQRSTEISSLTTNAKHMHSIWQTDSLAASTQLSDQQDAGGVSGAAR